MDQTTAPNLGKAAPLSLHQRGYFGTNWLLRFEMIKEWYQSLTLLTFDPRWKLGRGGGICWAGWWSMYDWIGGIHLPSNCCAVWKIRASCSY